MVRSRHWNDSFPGGLAVKNLPALQETQEMQARSLGREDPLVEEMTMPSSILVPWTEEPGELRSLGVTKSWTRLATEHTHWKGNQAQSLEWGDFRPEAWVEGKVRVLSPLKCKQGGAANRRKLAVRRRWWARVEWARRAESGDDGRHTRSGPGAGTDPAQIPELAKQKPAQCPHFAYSLS